MFIANGINPIQNNPNSFDRFCLIGAYINKLNCRKKNKYIIRKEVLKYINLQFEF